MLLDFTPLGDDNRLQKALDHSGFVFNNPKETWLSVPVPAAEVLSKVVIPPLVLTEGRKFLESDGPAVGPITDGKPQTRE